MMTRMMTNIHADMAAVCLDKFIIIPVSRSAASHPDDNR